MSRVKILLTGGTGYIGSHTAVELIEAGDDVVLVDNLFNSKRDVVEKIAKITGTEPKFYEVDLCDAGKLAEVFEKEQFDAVIHFAGLKAVGESVEQPLRYYENNIGSTVNLLKCMQEFGVKKIVFSSSATVYGTPDSPKYVETMLAGVNITSPYGKTKYMIEEIIRDVTAANPDFSATLLRYFNPIGAHPSGLLGEEPCNRPNNLMPFIMKVASGELPELSIYGNDYPTPDGTCIRDYIHVVDLARGHLKALEHAAPGVQLYNLGSGHGTSVLELVKAFTAASGKNLPYKIVERRAGDLPEFYADPSLAEAELGWHTELTIDDAMRDTLNYLRKSGQLH